MNTKWEEKELSIEDFKRELPNVLVKWENRIYTGKPGGRLCEFCHLAIAYRKEIGGHWKSTIGPVFEISWKTITRCYNNNKPVII
jgi:hypothetical protein